MSLRKRCVALAIWNEVKWSNSKGCDCFPSLAMTVNIFVQLLILWLTLTKPNFSTRFLTLRDRYWSEVNRQKPETTDFPSCRSLWFWFIFGIHNKCWCSYTWLSMITTPYTVHNALIDDHIELKPPSHQPLVQHGVKHKDHVFLFLLKPFLPLPSLRFFVPF